MKNNIDKFFQNIIDSISFYNGNIQYFHILGTESIHITTEIEYSKIINGDDNKIIISALNQEHSSSYSLIFDDFNQFFKMSQFFDPDRIIQTFFYIQGINIDNNQD